MFGPNICALKERVSCKLLSSRGEIMMFTTLSGHLVSHLFLKCLCLAPVPRTGTVQSPEDLYIRADREIEQNQNPHTALPSNTDFT